MDPRVLVIDDEESLLDMLQLALEMMGCVVVTVSSLAEGRRRALEGRFDLVLLDNHFPEGHGDALVPVLLECLPNAPVVIVTANDTDEHVRNALRLGASQVLCKPFGLDELGAIVKRHCGAAAEQVSNVA
jgi:DNA-binding response OmpR family regulator